MHHREAGQGRNADPHQGVVAALGDEQHHRDHQHDPDLEEQRQADDRGDQDHRPRHGALARLREDRVDDLVRAAGVGEQLAEDGAERDEDADTRDGRAETRGEARYRLRRRGAGERTERQGADGQREERVHLELGDEQDDDGDARQDGDAQLRVAGRSDGFDGIRCQHLDAETGHGEDP